MTARAATVALLLLCAFPVQAGGSADAMLEKWELYSVTSDFHATLLFDVGWSHGATAYAVEYVDAVPVAHGFFHFSDGAVHASVDGDPSGYTIRVGYAGNSAEAGWPMRFTGSRTLLVVWTGGVTSVARSVEGNGSFALIAEGPARGYTGQELGGTAFAGAAAANVAGYSSALRRLDFDIEHHLVGWFLIPPPLGGANVASATLTSQNTADACYDPLYDGILRRELGDERIRDCLYHDIVGPNARGSGSYRFEWTGVGAAYGDVPLLAWADVRWPGE